MPRRSTTCRLAPVALLGLMLIGAGGCDERPRSSAPVPSGEVDAAPPSQWQRDEERLLVAVQGEGEDEALLAAIAEAQATADEAREKWENSTAAAREQWAVKWAAPLSEGGVEHVWVQPLQWSAFRIEGRLASEPRAALLCGKRGGALVSFPIDELTDWIHLPTGDWSGPREGGYTVKVLEERYGKP